MRTLVFPHLALLGFFLVFFSGTLAAQTLLVVNQGDANLSYPVDIEIANSATKPVKAGMYGTAHFILPQEQPMMLIPRSAFNGGVNSGEVYVMRGGLARIQKVIAGRIYGDKVEVREGLPQGDTVITSGQVNLVDGTPVTVQKQ